MVTFSGPSAMDVYAAKVIASGLRLYAKTGMKPNAHYTPKNMMAAATRITGKTFKARDYEGAAAALCEFADNRAANLEPGDSITL